jgi:hypothetical protein
MRYGLRVSGRVALALVLVACGSRRAEPIGPGDTKEAVLPAGPPLVTPGERMSYRVQIGGIDLATYEMGVGRVVAIGSRRAIVVQGHAKATRLVSAVANVDDVFTSWIDVETGRPLRWTVEEHTAEGAVREGTDARFAERNGDGVPVEMRLLDKEPFMETQRLSLPEVWDYNALLVALRAWEDNAGATTRAEVMRGRYLWNVTVTVRGEETLHTELGEFPALRFDGLAYRLERDGTRAKDEERNFSLWISNDDGRVPLQNIAQSDYGDIYMTISDYQPGNGGRFR